MTYRGFYNICATTIDYQSRYKFFRDGAARRAALAAMRAQEAGCGREVVIDALAGSLEQDSHVCYFDDPCDAFSLKVA